MECLDQVLLLTLERQMNPLSIDPDVAGQFLDLLQVETSSLDPIEEIEHQVRLVHLEAHRVALAVEHDALSI